MTLRSALIPLALATSLVSHAGAAERVVLEGPRAEIWNPAGPVVLEPGDGPDVVVVLERSGRDAARLRVVADRVEGAARLRVLHSGDRIVYAPPGSRGHSSSTVRMRADGTWGGQPRGLGGRRLIVASSGSGSEAHASLRVQVPRGRAVTVHVIRGDGSLAGVEADVRFDGGASAFASRDSRGSLAVDVGSGAVAVLRHHGDLLVDTGSGDVRASRIEGGRVSLDTGSGLVSCEDVRSDEVQVDTGSGEVTLAGIDAERLSVDTGSGAVTARLLARRTDVSIDTGSGGVRLEFPREFGADLRVSTGSGGIRSDFEIAASERSRDSLIGRIGGGGSRVVIETGSGSVQLLRAR